LRRRFRGVGVDECMVMNLMNGFFFFFKLGILSGTYFPRYVYIRHIYISLVHLVFCHDE